MYIIDTKYGRNENYLSVLMNHLHHYRRLCRYIRNRTTFEFPFIKLFDHQKNDKFVYGEQANTV